MCRDRAHHGFQTDGTWIAFNELDARESALLLVAVRRTVSHDGARIRDRQGPRRVVRTPIRLRFCRRMFRFQSAIAFQFDRALSRSSSASADEAYQKRDVEKSKDAELHP